MHREGPFHREDAARESLGGKGSLATSLHCLVAARIGLRTIHPLVDDYPERYARGLEESAEDSLGALRRHLRVWRYVAPEALEIVRRMTARSLRFFLHELRRERRGEPSGKPLPDDFFELRMPATMFVVSLAASHLRLSWGSAFHGLLKQRVLVEREGAIWPEKGGLRSILERVQRMPAPGARDAGDTATLRSSSVLVVDRGKSLARRPW
jgi:hypothetical protein